MATPISTTTKLDQDLEGEAVDQKYYRGMIGSLLYITASRPNINFSVGLCARFQSDPRKSHLYAVKRIFRYLASTTNISLRYPRTKQLTLKRYFDADYTGCRIDRKSTSGTCFFFGPCLISWTSKKQNTVALSTIEAEYMVAGSCCSQILWLKQMLSDFAIYYDSVVVPIFFNNTSAIHLSYNLIFHSRAKHIEVHYHFLRDHISKGDIYIEHCLTNKQLTNIFTKPFALE